MEQLHLLNQILSPLTFVIKIIFSLPGIITLLVLFLLWFILNLRAKIRLAFQTQFQTKSGDKVKLKFIEILSIFFVEAGKMLAGIAVQVPMFLLLIGIAGALAGVSVGTEALEKFLENEKYKQELTQTLKNLKESTKFADIQILSQEKNTTKIKILYYNSSDYTKPANEETLELLGKEIYFDSYVLNFDYSLIEKSEISTIVIPYRIFSEEIPADQGFMLKLMSGEEIPIAFEKKSESVFGIEYDRYKIRLVELFKTLHDQNELRKLGIRSFVGNAVHKKVSVGEKYSLWAEPSGGITLKPDNFF